MVFFFTCSDPRYSIYMGRDKYENEHLIAHGWPEDLWFHVDKHSSAHVYLRMPKGETIDDVPSDIIAECAQLTKANSIEGCKLSHVQIIYTPWANLDKRENMADGSVSHKDRRAVKVTMVEHRINAIVNRLEKTKVEKNYSPTELYDMRRARDAKEDAEDRARKKAERKQAAIDKETARAEEESRLADLKALEKAAQEEADVLQTETERRIKEHFARIAASDASASASSTNAAAGVAKKTGSKQSTSGGGGAVDAVLADALFGGGIYDRVGCEGSDDDDDDDDGNAFGIGGLDISDSQSAGGGTASKGVALRKKESGKLGKLGQEVADVEAARKTAKEMDALTAVAHERKAEAQRKAEEAAQAKAAKEAAKEAELALKRSQMAEGKVKVAETVRAARDAANTALASLSTEAIAEVHDANESSQAEELMVLEAIFAEGFVRSADGEEDADAAAEGAPAGPYTLRVEGETAAGAPVAVVLRVTPVPEYPSHHPPVCEVLEGIADESDAAFVADSLHAVYYSAREALGEGEPGECIVHQWAEWLREEWMAQM